MALTTYYSNDQFKKYFIQFMAIFSGMQVEIGKNDRSSEPSLISVPIFHGARDRVV